MLNCFRLTPDRIRPDSDQRRGAMLVLVSALLVILVAMCLFTVDVAYMQLTRSELRAATDAAAKAGAETLRRTKDEGQARSAAKDIAGKNQVGGRPLVLLDSEIEFGTTQLQPDGSWQFAGGGTPSTAVRISSEVGGSSGNAPIQLFFADYFGSGTFEPTRVSTAAHTATEICLCIDRSHSMCFDMTGISWSYPPGTPMRPDPVTRPPHPTKSRWGVLMNAVQDFVNVTKDQNPRPRVALVTWGSDITLADYEGRLTGRTFPAVNFDLPLSTNHGQIISSLNGRATIPMLGGTNMAAGLQAGINVLTAANVDPLASRILVLMSDGQWTVGDDPVNLISTANSQNITVHTVSLLSTVNLATMEEIAEGTGGRMYPAANETQLRSAFQEIAQQLPVVLTD